MKTLALIATAAALTLSSPALAADFSFSFTWGNIKDCNSGRPNRVDNPRFVLKNVPAGTKYIAFKMMDKDVPSYNHGGGTVEYTGQKVIEPGAFRYKSPCPPGGTHTYEWTASAKSKKFGGVLGTAKAQRDYPD